VEQSVLDLLNAAASAVAAAAEGLRNVSVASAELATASRALVDQTDILCTRTIAKLDVESCRNEGQRDLSEWMLVNTNARPGEGERRKSIAVLLAKLPLWSDAIDAGTVGMAQLQLLASMAKGKRLPIVQRDEAMLLRHAQQFTFDGFRKVMKHWAGLCDDTITAPETEDAELEERRLQLVQMQNGMWHLDGLLDKLAGETLDTALKAAMPKPSEGDNRSPAQRRHDALIDIAMESLANADRPDIGGERPHVSVIIDAESGLAHTSQYLFLSSVTRDMLLCDCVTTSIWLSKDGTPFDVGTPESSVPVRNRRAVMARDRCCRYPGCGREARWTEIHHIKYRENGGTHEISNLTALCRFHHRFVHRKGLNLYWDSDNVTLIVEWPNGILKHSPPIRLSQG
jgi:Domain of unknown function (DUF222)/HNH endonuclease